MKPHLEIKGKKLYYSDQGTGHVVVLLHGYLESLKIWNDFAEQLSKKFRVICFDIPGHGLSETICSTHSMQQLAGSIYEALKFLKISDCFMVGHSMGGYVTLQFQKQYLDMLSGFCLFHSHPFADSQETKKKRLREIELIKEGKKDLIAKFNIPNAFATKNTDNFKSSVNEAINIALQTPNEGIIANLHAMMNRSDLSDSLEKTTLPFIYIAGKYVNYIDYNTVIPKIKLPKKSTLVRLENSGHMGFIEEKELALYVLSQFININQQ